MATTENEHYLRSILLLAEGGSYISKMILYRELSDDLDALLKSFESKLKHELHEKQFEKLFPGHGKTAVDTWDLQMLIIVVLRLFHSSLKPEEKRNLRVIKMLRNEVQAHNPSATLDDVQFDNIKDQLTDALTSLASGFDEDVKKECRSYINKYASGSLDVMSARECLKQLQENDAMFKQVLEKVEKSNNDICACVNATQTAVSQQIADLEKILIEGLGRLDMGTCRKKIKVGMHVELMLGGPTEEWILLMERTLNDIFNEAYKTSGGKFEDMKKTVEELLEDMKQNTSIKFKGSKTKCIILMFECFTFAGLLDFLKYIASQKYRDRLDALTIALSAHFRVDIPVTVTSKITAACLQNAIDILDATVEPDEKKREADNCQTYPSDEYKKSLRLALECSSAEDLVYLWKMFQQGGAKHYLDRIADVLSEHSGQRITLSSSIDLEEFKEAIEETENAQARPETVERIQNTKFRKSGYDQGDGVYRPSRGSLVSHGGSGSFNVSRGDVRVEGSRAIDILSSNQSDIGSTVDVVRGTSKTTAHDDSGYLKSMSYETWLDDISRCEESSEIVSELNCNTDEYFCGFRGLNMIRLTFPTALYRVLSPLEDIENGIVCKNVNSPCTVAQHIASGSRYPSRFISTTLDLNVAAHWAFYEMETPERRPRAVPLRIVEIDIKKLVGTQTEKNCINLCDKEVREHFIKGATHRSWAISSKEILFQCEIPKYVEKLFPYSWSVYCDEVYHVLTHVIKPSQPPAKKPKKKKQVSLE